ncbi:MAG: hypothetical protein IKD08_03805 [Alphaproteobacteria bacterium]|nr:hypothetical protein [Alphaproteobacteria bacterium]
MSNKNKEPKKVFHEIVAIVNAARYDKQGELYVELNDSAISKEVAAELHHINTNAPRYGKVILNDYINDPELRSVIQDEVLKTRSITSSNHHIEHSIG